MPKNKRVRGFSRGKFPRGFSVSITAIPGGRTRVIVWRRADTDGNKRIKLSDEVIGDGGAIQLAAPAIGGAGNRRKVTVTISADHVKDNVP